MIPLLLFRRVQSEGCQALATIMITPFSSSQEKSKTFIEKSIDLGIVEAERVQTIEDLFAQVGLAKPRTIESSASVPFDRDFRPETMKKMIKSIEDEFFSASSAEMMKSAAEKMRTEIKRAADFAKTLSDDDCIEGFNLEDYLARLVRPLTKLSQSDYFDISLAFENREKFVADLEASEQSFLNESLQSVKQMRKRPNLFCNCFQKQGIFEESHRMLQEKFLDFEMLSDVAQTISILKDIYEAKKLLKSEKLLKKFVALLTLFVQELRKFEDFKLISDEALSINDVLNYFVPILARDDRSMAADFVSGVTSTMNPLFAYSKRSHFWPMKSYFRSKMAPDFSGFIVISSLPVKIQLLLGAPEEAFETQESIQVVLSTFASLKSFQISYEKEEKAITYFSQLELMGRYVSILEGPSELFDSFVSAFIVNFNNFCKKVDPRSSDENFFLKFDDFLNTDVFRRVDFDDYMMMKVFNAVVLSQVFLEKNKLEPPILSNSKRPSSLWKHFLSKVERSYPDLIEKMFEQSPNQLNFIADTFLFDRSKSPMTYRIVKPDGLSKPNVDSP